MSSLRWYDANVDVVGLRPLTDALMQAEYRATRNWGFRITERRRSYVEGTYHERVRRLEEVADPFGRVTEYERVEYRTVGFVLRRHFPALEVRDVVRGMGQFVAHLGDCAGDRLSVSAVRVDVSRWLAALEESTRVQVLGLRIADVALAADAKLTMKIQGASDVRAKVHRFLGRRSHRIKSALVQWPEGRDNALCEIWEVGRVAFKEGQTSKHERYLREALASCGC